MKIHGRWRERRSTPVPAEGVVHCVVQGESIDSLGYQYGHAVDTIWHHPRNAGLREQRGDWRVLHPGDNLYIPPVRPAHFPSKETARRHIFRRTDVPSLLRFRPLILGHPTKGAPYEVRIDGELIGTGKTNAHGDVEFEIAPDEPQVSVRVFFDGFSRDYEIRLRALNPIYEMSGIQQRLAAMGFYQVEADEESKAATDEAIACFRMRYGLHDGHGLDDKLRDAIHRLFGG